MPNSELEEFTCGATRLVFDDMPITKPLGAMAILAAGLGEKGVFLVTFAEVVGADGLPC